MVLINSGFITIFLIVLIWDAVWKIVGAWNAGRNNQPVWFVFILVLNTVGILPLIYLIWFEKNKNPRPAQEKRNSKKK